MSNIDNSRVVNKNDNLLFLFFNLAYKESSLKSKLK